MGKWPQCACCFVFVCLTFLTILSPHFHALLPASQCVLIPVAFNGKKCNKPLTSEFQFGYKLLDQSHSLEVWEGYTLLRIAVLWTQVITVAQVTTTASVQFCTAWSETGVMHFAKRTAHMLKMLVVISEIQPFVKFLLMAIQN